MASARPLIRQGLARIAERTRTLEIIAETSSLVDAALLSRIHRPDTVLVDLADARAGLGHPASLTRLLRETEAVVALVGPSDTDRVHGLLGAGVRGILSDDVEAETLQGALDAVRKGIIHCTATAPPAQHAPDRKAARSHRPRITAREHQVLQLLVRGMTNREIGLALHISETTVKYHLMNLIRRCRAHGRTELAFLAAELDLLSGL
ncbi:response regulator transcription factor [Pseudonocardia kujensis]|uniref:response regulator transcription factor n=1 Tax=Pseudonocardia kujensis TaxID=1128675 RepID=UPI001E3CC0A4|nr:response regulator transcription factor [Pseudonocardia kujensis]